MLGGFCLPCHAVIWPGQIPSVLVLGCTLGSTLSIPISGWGMGYPRAGVSLQYSWQQLGLSKACSCSRTAGTEIAVGQS